MELKNKFILDATCGSRSIWFQKAHPNAIYTDIRKVSGLDPSRPNFKINPDQVMDFRALKFPDKTFRLIVWDPPHFKSLSLDSWIGKRYGTLDPETWEEDIKKGFSEIWRVLRDHGILIFKWSKPLDGGCKKRVISISKILKLIEPIRPLFGHPSGSKANTIWMCFMKIPQTQKEETNG